LYQKYRRGSAENYDPSDLIRSAPCRHQTSEEQRCRPAKWPWYSVHANAQHCLLREPGPVVWRWVPATFPRRNLLQPWLLLYGVINARMRANISTKTDEARSTKLPRLSQIINRPNINATGKPSAKIFICGAARVMMPKAKLVISSAVNAGRASSNALENTQLMVLTRRK